MDFASLPRSDLVDDGGRLLDALLLVTADMAEAVADAVAQGYAVMPAGGLTSAIGSYDYDRDGVSAFKGVIAIRPKGASEAELVDSSTPPQALKSNQVSIDTAKGLIAAGAGLTISQVDAALSHHAGPGHHILIDLTSVGSAYVGGVVATGGMGPLRLRPSVTLESVVIADGGEPRVLSGADIQLVEGMQGWTGMVVAAVFRYYQVPVNEFGLVLPVQGSDVDSVAGLLAYLEPWTRVSLPEPGGRLGNGATVLNGIELVSRDSLEVFVEHAQDPARNKAQGLLQSCEYAGADMLACVTGWSEDSVDDVLFSLMDTETETIGGVTIEYGVGFSSGSEMDTFRAIREGAPDLARTRARVQPEGMKKPWTTTTDVNIDVPPDSGAIADILAAYADYRSSIRALGKELAGSVTVELAAYGHLSPNGIDPHHRVTLFAALGQDDALAAARQIVADGKKLLISTLLQASNRNNCRITGGEKGAPSLVEIARAAGGEANLPDELKERFSLVRQAVKAAAANFNFRAPQELREG